MCVSPFVSFEQTNSPIAIEARLKSGFLLGHRGVMAHMPQEHTFAGEISFVLRTNGKKEWHKTYKYPDIGLTFFGGTVGNNKILGQYFGAYSSISFPFIARDKFRLNGKMGAGLGVGTKQYDPIKNPKNVAMSAPLNALICFGLDGRYYFKKNWISLGIDLTHFSNAAFKVPNLGINLPYGSIAFGRKVNEGTQLEGTIEKTIPRRKVLFGITGVISAKEVFPTGGKKYPVFGLSVHARTFLKPKVGWELSIDAFSKQAIFGYRPQIEKTQLGIVQLGVFAGYLLPLDRFHFVLGMGYYVRDKYHPEDMVYHRIGFRYYCKNGLILNSVLKSHWARADYAEFGIGYCFNWKK